MQKLLATFVLALFVTTPVWAATQTVTLSVPDMNCPACPFTVKKALSKVEGVGKIDVSLEKHEAVVAFDDSKATIKQLTEATEAAGYPATLKH